MVNNHAQAGEGYGVALPSNEVIFWPPEGAAARPGSQGARGNAGSGLLRLLLMIVVALPMVVRAGLPLELYRSSFEPEAGYTNGLALEGTDGWVASGEPTYQGENGITSGYFSGFGQQAFIGGSLDAIGAETYSVWRPLNWTPPAGNTQLVRFSVYMSIAASSDTNQDNFYWSVYTIDGTRLFTLDFDTYWLGVYALLEDDNDGQYTEVTFENDVIYRLQISMDFARNRWHAQLDDTVLATNQPITTAQTRLTLGDIDAQWRVYNWGVPGDNFMAFDDYDLTLGGADGPVIVRYNRAGPGTFVGQIRRAEPGRSYLIESTAAFGAWSRVSTNIADPSGTFDFVDRNLAGDRQRFYRARLLP